MKSLELFRLSIVLCTLMMCEVLGNAQSRTVTGEVKNDFGSVVSGANVSVKNTAVNTVTDSEGSYSISVDGDDAILVFMLDGYSSVEVPVGNQNVINVTMIVEDIFAVDLEDLMNTVISSSSFFDLKTSETPGYIYSIDLQKVYASQSLIELARMIIPGLCDGAHPDTELIGVRGMKAVDNSKTMVMFDGQSLNIRGNVGYGVGLNSKLLGDVKNVEVSLGPNAIVHGSGAISGYINMTPKNGFDNPGAFVSVAKEYEKNADNQSRGISKAELGYGFGSKKYNAYVYGGYYYSNGWMPDSAFESTYTKEILEEVRVNDTHKANFRLSALVNLADLKVNAGYMQNYHTSLPADLSSYGIQYNFTRQFNSRLTYTLRPTDVESVDFVLGNEMTDLGRFCTSGKLYGKSGGGERHTEGKIILKTTRINNNSLAIGTLYGVRKFNQGDFFFGSDVNSSWGDAQYIKDPQTGADYLIEKNVKDTTKIWASGQMPDGEWNEFALFAEDIYKLNEKLVVALGLRFDLFNIDDINDTQKNLAPRVAFSYLLNDNHVVKASYQQGFRTMDYYNVCHTMWNKTPIFNYRLYKYDQRAIDNGDTAFPCYSFSIKPETVHSIELNYHGDFAQKVFSVDANVFYNIYQNTIDNISLVTWTTDKYLADPENYRGDYTKTGLKYFDEDVLRRFSDQYFSSSKYRRTKGGYGNFAAYVNNGEDIKILGGEIIANYNPSANTRVNATYSLSKSLTDSYADQSQCPTSQLKAGATQYLFDRKLTLNAQFMFEPSLEDNDDNRTNYHDVYFQGRTMLDVAAAYTVKNHITIQGTVNNLLGEERPGITYKPNTSDNYTQRTNIGCSERQYWLAVKVNF